MRKRKAGNTKRIATIALFIILIAVVSLSIAEIMQLKDRVSVLTILVMEERDALDSGAEIDYELFYSSDLESLGMFTATHYCNENYPHICNNGSALHTASGSAPTPGRTIAVDPDVIPLGTTVVIDGKTYIAEDTGGAVRGKKVDILVSSHEEALRRGITEKEIFIN